MPRDDIDPLHTAAEPNPLSAPVLQGVHLICIEFATCATLLTNYRLALATSPSVVWLEALLSAAGMCGCDDVAPGGAASVRSTASNTNYTARWRSAEPRRARTTPGSSR